MTSWPVWVLPGVLLGSAAFAAPASAAAPVPAEHPSSPPAAVSLTVTPGPAGGPWRMRIENTGEEPVRIPADPRLLVLELTAAPEAASENTSDKTEETGKGGNGGKGGKLTKPRRATDVGDVGDEGPPLRCALPDDTRPSMDTARELVIFPKRSWSASFDPLFYCFGSRERAALIPNTSVKARFGWPAPPAPRPRRGKETREPVLAPPFAVTPLVAPPGAARSTISPSKVIDAEPFVLAEAAIPVPRSSSRDEPPEDAPGALTLSVPEAMDSARGIELGTTIRLTNGTDRPITLLYRPEVLVFTVSGPAGNVSCGTPRQVASPIRELFSTVPASGKLDVTMLLTAACPAGTFDEPGVYRILPKLDTTGASGRALGIATWDGVASAKVPLLLRVRMPRTAVAPSKPTLD